MMSCLHGQHWSYLPTTDVFQALFPNTHQLSQVQITLWFFCFFCVLATADNWTDPSWNNVLTPVTRQPAWRVPSKSVFTEWLVMWRRKRCSWKTTAVPITTPHRNIYFDKTPHKVKKHLHATTYKSCFVNDRLSFLTDLDSRNARFALRAILKRFSANELKCKDARIYSSHQSGY